MTTSEPRSRLIKTLKERGFIYQATDLEALDALAEQESVSAYIGFDATADSLHVGSLVQIMLLRWLQKTGHRPIALMGGGTTKVGDPSGKDESRRLLTIEGINKNIEGIKRCFESYLTFGNGKNDAVMVNNADWLDELKYIEFLRDYGRHFSVNRMLKFDSVKLRLDRDQPLTFLEFNYMVLQAYDFVELARRYDCRLQMGGSDQYGNILNGIELGRRVAGKELFGLTAPLITTSSGAKMGKTAAGAVWLNSDRLSPYDFWQFWRNTDDADVGRFLRLFTDLPIERIRELEGKRGADINEAKIVLANEATALCHGKPAASSAQATATRTFIEGGLGQDLPVVELPIAELSSGIPAYELLHRANLVTSNSEGRRKIKGRGARLNNEKIEDENYRVSDADLDAAGRARLSIGNTHTVIVGLMSPGASEDEFLKYLRPELPINSWVMIVDDDEKFRNELIEKLERQGIGAVGVKTATAALDLLRTKSPQPRLLFTDAFLFGPMSGKKLAREARQRWPRLNVLVRWNNRSMSEREKLQLREHITVLPESCSADETAQKITSILRSTNA